MLVQINVVLEQHPYYGWRTYRVVAKVGDGPYEEIMLANPESSLSYVVFHDQKYGFVVTVEANSYDKEVD